jgi:phosphoenolpyruvate carboxykinase (ATP)
MIKAALDGGLSDVNFTEHEFFGISIPEHCPDVPDEILDPVKTWNDEDAYEKRAIFLANAFMKNFERFASYATDKIIAGSPRTLSKQ